MGCPCWKASKKEKKVGVDTYADLRPEQAADKLEVL